jgi:hypothetical protein
VVSQQATGGADTDALESIENVEGSAFADTMLGSTTANLLRGVAGDDHDRRRRHRHLPVRGRTTDVDIVTDFTDGEDKLSFVGFGFSEPADIIPWAGQAGDDTAIILFDPNSSAVSTVILVGLAYANLDASDFGLVAA